MNEHMKIMLLLRLPKQQMSQNEKLLQNEICIIISAGCKKIGSKVAMALSGHTEL